MKALQAHHSIVARRRVPAPPPGGSTDYSPYLVEQDFEGSGYDNGETWGSTNSPDPDYTTALEGSQSMRINSTAEIMRAWKTITPTGSLTLCAMVQLNSLPPDNGSILELWNSGYAGVAAIQQSGGHLRGAHNSVGVIGSFTLATGTLYYIWMEYEKGTGANGILKVYISTTSTKPGSPDISVTTGDAAADIEHVMIGHTGSFTADLIYDHVRVKAGASGTVTDWPL